MVVAVMLDGTRVAGHFGQADGALLCTFESGRGLTTAVTHTLPEHAPGVFPRWLQEHGATVVLVGGMGHKAQEFLRRIGVTVVDGVLPQEAAEAARAWHEGRLERGPGGCTHGGHHQCHHEH